MPLSSRATPSASRVAFIGSYLPRRCGIASFTHDLRKAVATGCDATACPVVAVNDGGGSYAYPPEVAAQIDQADLTSYENAAGFLNHAGIDAVSLQHEFGIFGGRAGAHILTLLRALHMPIVTTLHTVLREPNRDQRRLMVELIRVSTRLVVMTEWGQRALQEVYGAPAERIDLIPHGIHDVPLEESERFKPLLAVEGRFVLLTFGLLSPNKGIEHVLEALPDIIARFPSTVYLVLGATHPALVREQGESYRLTLERLARQLGVEQHVIFYNRFVDLPELKEFIGAADIYLTPYLNEQQVVSGTLAYAFGAGKPVISTPYWHAAELLAGDRGVLVPFADSAAIAREVCALLGDESRRNKMRRQAHHIGRSMIWSHVADAYRASFARARPSPITAHRPFPLVRTLAKEWPRLPPFNGDHILRLTDSTGILQHALYSFPDYNHGYCTDDNARALLLALRWHDLGETSSALDRVRTSCAAFLAHAFNPGSGRFRNFMGYDRRWLEAAGSEDSHGRALWALGACVDQSWDRGLALLARGLFEQALACVLELQHPRTWAFTLLGLDAFLRGETTANVRAAAVRVELTRRLLERFAAHTRDDWHWFADDASYDNARLPQALLLSGRALQQPATIATALQALEWLYKLQVSPEGCLQPIGSNGFCHRNGQRAAFDQQPVEAQGMVAACLEAHRVTADPIWLQRARIAFEWFLGHNDLGLMLYDPKSGGCRDALHADRVNENQGAESTLAFHLARAELQIVHNELANFDPLLAGGLSP